jgi:hypothetical protein
MRNFHEMNVRFGFCREYLKPGEGHVEDVLFNAHVRLLSLLGYAWNHPHLKLTLVANVWTRRRFAGSSGSSTSTDASSSSTDAVPPGKLEPIACCQHVYRHACTVVYLTEALSLLDDEDAVVGRAMMLAALMLRWRLLDGQSLVLRDADGGPLRYGLFLTFLIRLSRTPSRTQSIPTHMAARRARRVTRYSARGQPADAPGLSRALGERGL